MGENEISEFLSHLANDRGVAPSTQNQALNAVVFLYKHYLKYDLGDFSSYARAKKPALLPVVLSRNEVYAILSKLTENHLLMTSLLYGAGLRLKECLRLRVKDIDFDRNQIFVRAGKGRKDRCIPLPTRIESALQIHLKKVKNLHEKDLSQGYGSVYLPNALARKYKGAEYDWCWQYVFPSRSLSKDPRSGITRRHHCHDSMLIRSLKKAAIETNIHKKLTTHSFRHSFATHSLEDGMNIRRLQVLLGHENIKTTMIYTHVTQRSEDYGQNPLDRLYAECETDTNLPTNRVVQSERHIEKQSPEIPKIPNSPETKSIAHPEGRALGIIKKIVKLCLKGLPYPQLFKIKGVFPKYCCERYAQSLLFKRNSS